MRYILFQQSLADKEKYKDKIFYYAIVDTCTNLRTVCFNARDAFAFSEIDLTKSANYCYDEEFRNILESNHFDELKNFLTRRSRHRNL